MQQANDKKNILTFENVNYVNVSQKKKNLIADPQFIRSLDKQKFTNVPKFFEDKTEADKLMREKFLESLNKQ